jgi:hypothetical protein
VRPNIPTIGWEKHLFLRPFVKIAGIAGDLTKQLEGALAQTEENDDRERRGGGESIQFLVLVL